MRSCAVLALTLALAAVAAPSSAQELVSSVCLGCICEASSKCDTTLGCQDGFCGPFRISPAFFIDSELSKEPNFAQYPYETCTKDPFCSAAVIRKYMVKYPRDCDGDGLQTCKDFALVHKAGPNACTNFAAVRGTEYWRRFEACVEAFDKPRRPDATRG